MAKTKNNKSRVQKFINYTKEAFFWPVHLVILGAITGLAVLGVLTLPEALQSLMDPALTTSSLIMMAGGAEMLALSAISRNPRFIRAINAKYHKDIEAFKKTKTLVEYYNELGLESQRRFDKLRKRIKDVREGFKKMNTSVPSLVNNLLNKLNAIELSYVRLLYHQDRIPTLANEDATHKTVSEIDKLNQDLKNAGNRLKQIKEKRLRLLEMRMDNYYKVRENKEVIEEQLQTIEEMVEYIKDQPFTLQNTQQEDMMIDNLLFETEQTQQSLEEIESLMQSEFYPGLVEDPGFDAEFGNFDSKTSE